MNRVTRMAEPADAAVGAASSGGPVGGLHRGSTAEELAAVLREMIMSGALPPDAPMREAALSERFEVSRRTVRDALGVLEHERLVACGGAGCDWDGRVVETRRI